MLKRRGLMLIVVSLTLGIFAAVGANNWLNTRLLENAEHVEGDVVVAAAMELPYGTKVESRHLKLLELPKGTAPAGAYRALEDVKGMVAKTAIESGEVLVGSRFVVHDQGSTLAALVESNMRAITVRVNDVIGVAGFLLPGNRVDVIAVRGGRGNTRATSDTVLHNIKVLAVDQTTATEENDPIIVRAVTLELTPDQALVLTKARAEGEIQLTLRNPVDDQIQIAQVTKPAPIATPKRKVVRRVAPADTTIQVIRGTKVAKEKTKGI